MNPPTLPASINRRVSRSNSTSSSVATVKHLGVKIGHRSSASQARPTSSDSINRHFSTLDATTEENMNTENLLTSRGRSPNLNINRWSHSTSSSVGAIDADFLRQSSGNIARNRSLRGNTPASSQLPSAVRSHLQAQHNNAPTPSLDSPPRSPAQPPRMNSTRTSPNGSRAPFRKQLSSEQISTLTRTPDLDLTASRAASNEYFGAAVLDHSRGANKYGQPVEGIALQFSASHTRQKRSDPLKNINGLYQSTNASHISLQKKSSHTRRRDRSANGSKDTAAGSSMSSTRSEHSKRAGHRSPTQKHMLSQALQKANQAVLQDNAQDVQGAIAAYNEACDILEQVMTRSNDPDDRRKLSAIRETYSTRIGELYDLDDSWDHLNLNRDKELPEAPTHTHYFQGQDRLSFEDPEDIDAPPGLDPDHPQRLMQIPLRQESLLPQIFGGDQYIDEQQPPPPMSGSRSRPPQPENLSVPMDAKYMPPPLSPRRPLSPSLDDLQTPTAHMPATGLGATAPERYAGSESISWLDTAGDNNSSGTSTRRSSLQRDSRDKDLMADIEAAVNASYEEDYPEEPTPRPSEAAQFDHLAKQSFDPKPAQDPVRRLISQFSQDNVGTVPRFDQMTREYLDEEAEEEEELLDMVMAEGYLHDQNQLPGAMSSLPRQSDSSGFSARSSGRTWESSATAATQGTALSTLVESPEVPQYSSEQSRDLEETTLPQEAEVFARKQASPLPPLPPSEKQAPTGLRDRRMSGQGTTQLKIETYSRRPSEVLPGQPATAPLLDVPTSQHDHPALNRSISDTNISVSTLPLTPLASIHSTDSLDPPDIAGHNQLFLNTTLEDEPTGLIRSDSSRTPQHLRQNPSASDLKPRMLSVTTTDLNDLPTTPGSALYLTHSRSGTISTPTVINPSPNVISTTAVGGMYIFDHIPDLVFYSQPRSPVSPTSEPLALEACPESFMLRPFWLMRCLYQTLAHPKGGYISQKLFIPRDIWRVRGVKIKALDDKIGQCDVLTAALLKLAKVDTLDADAVLEELQSFDGIIENVRTALIKKLGSDVGLIGSVANMKNSPAGEEPEAVVKSSSVKSFASSWRKLRSKSSAAVLAAPPNQGRKETSSEQAMSSLPMTGNSAPSTSRSYRSQRYPPPTPTNMPQIPTMNANYMSSLARLFDAVQVLDSIARQVIDPGLKASNQTQVGLELSMRGAAEFFSFYIIRFAMADITIMIDKYLKRNGEWVMT